MPTGIHGKPRVHGKAKYLWWGRVAGKGGVWATGNTLNIAPTETAKHLVSKRWKAVPNELGRCACSLDASATYVAIVVASSTRQ